MTDEPTDPALIKRIFVVVGEIAKRRGIDDPMFALGAAVGGALTRSLTRHPNLSDAELIEIAETAARLAAAPDRSN